MEEIRQEIIDFNLQFPQFAHFRITDKIGEGTFSSVYLAVDLKHYHYANCAHTDPDCCIVALKRIYPNSSPSRILNELATLRELGHHPNIATLIEVMRHQDQIVAVLPFFAHDLFRDYFRHLDTAQIRTYLGGLLLALERVHRCRIIHRDIKPSNFLYNVAKGKGVLVDFGLAQVFNLIQKQALGRLEKPSGPHRGPKGGYIEDDPRPSVRASRAGTRGFRAPEVLFKVVHQTTAIDMWSVGVILLSILTGVFPFFQSNDDQDALVEISILFGKTAISNLARKLKRSYETNIPTISNGQPLDKLIKKLRPDYDADPLVLDLLSRFLELDWEKRITASDALDHEFFAEDDSSS